MIIADASLTIAFLHVHDAHHSTAVDIVVEHDDLLLHPVTAAEVLVGPSRSGIANDALADLEAAGFRVDVPDTAQPLRAAALRRQTGLKLPDCYPFDLAQAHRTALATFDERLAWLAREAGISAIGT